MRYDDVRRRRNMLIVKPNELAQKSRSLLTGKQIDIIEYILSCVRPGDTEDTIYDFDVKEFCKVFGLHDTSGTHYAGLKEELKNIADVSCWIVDGKRHSLFRWLNRVDIDTGSGVIQVSFHETVRKYIFNLNPQNGYFKYELGNVAALSGSTGRNKYPKMVFFFLRSYVEQGGITVSVEDFCKLHCPTEYTEYRRINQRILKPAQDKINELTDINFYYKPLKSKGSNSTTHIQFTIYRKRGEQLKGLEEKQGIAIDGEFTPDLPF